MSGWTPYLDLLMQDPLLKTGGIFGSDGALWAARDDLGVTTAEALILFKGTKNVSQFQANGMLAGGSKYMYLTASPDPGSQSTQVGRKGPTTLLVRPTVKALIVALTKDGINPANVRQVSYLARELESRGF